MQNKLQIGYVYVWDSNALHTRVWRQDHESFALTLSAKTEFSFLDINWFPVDFSLIFI